MSTTAEPAYRYRADWVSRHVPNWSSIFTLGVPRDKVLEIGSFEGRASCWFLQHFMNPTGALYCVDTWEGGNELPPGMARYAYDLFLNNTSLAIGPEQSLTVLKKRSVEGLTELLQTGHENTFDLIYVDASHQAPAVLTDAVLSFHLLKQGGILLFDDYTMDLQKPLDQRPKFAIDTFAAIFNDKLHTILVMDQFAVRKTKI